MHARHSVEVTTKPGLAAAEARFERQVRERFPEITDEAEIARRAYHLREAFFLELAVKGLKARQAKRAGETGNAA